MGYVASLITKLLGDPKEICGQTHGLGHLHRWTIFNGKRYKLCLDHSSGGGLSHDITEYSKPFVSIGFAELQDAKRLHASPEGPAWMLLIGKSW